MVGGAKIIKDEATRAIRSLYQVMNSDRMNHEAG